MGQFTWPPFDFRQHFNADKRALANRFHHFIADTFEDNDKESNSRTGSALIQQRGETRNVKQAVTVKFIIHCLTGEVYLLTSR